jgi:hypothetical protein
VSGDFFGGDSCESGKPMPNNGLIGGLKSKTSSSVGEIRVLGSKTRARAPAPEPRPDDWRLEPHVCRSCFSRLVSRPVQTQALNHGPAVGPTRLYQCTNCGLEAAGGSAAVLCSCGIKLRKATKAGRSSVVLVDAGIRCAANPEIRADFSQLYVALDAGPGA